MYHIFPVPEQFSACHRERMIFLTLSQIRYFLTTARCLNYTTAAKELYMSQPALSRQVAAMEEELGVKLFERRKSALILTPMGNMLRDEFTSLMLHYNEILQKVYAVGSDNSIHFRIGILEGFGLGDVLPHLLRHCGEMLPHLQIELSTASYGNLVHQLQVGTLDLILTFSHDISDYPDILSEEILSIPTFLVYHEDSIDAQTRKENGNSLLLILNSPEDSSGTFSLQESLISRLGLVSRYKIADSTSQQLFWVHSGYGSAFLAGNSELRNDPSMVFEKHPALPDAKLTAAWHTRSSSQDISTVVSAIHEMLRESSEFDWCTAPDRASPNL